MRQSHDRAPSRGQGPIDVLTAIDSHPRQHLLAGQAAQEKEVHQHPAVVLEGAAGDTSDLGIVAVAADHRRVVVERGPSLRGAEPEPRGAAGRRGGLTQAHRHRAQQARARPVASAEQLRPAWCGRRGGRGH